MLFTRGISKKEEEEELSIRTVAQKVKLEQQIKNAQLISFSCMLN
jgi:hypothetical protein